MNHISEENLIEFADGALPPGQQMAVEAHLAACAQCSEELKLYRSLSVLMEKENVLMAPPSMTNRVMQQVELHQLIMQRKAKSRRTAIWFAAIMIGFLSVFIGLGVIFDQGGGPGTQIPGFIRNILDYMLGIEFSLKNPLILYAAVSVVILLFADRIFRPAKPGKVVA